MTNVATNHKSISSTSNSSSTCSSYAINFHLALSARARRNPHHPSRLCPSCTILSLLHPIESCSLRPRPVLSHNPAHRNAPRLSLSSSNATIDVRPILSWPRITSTPYNSPSEDDFWPSNIILQEHRRSVVLPLTAESSIAVTVRARS